MKIFHFQLRDDLGNKKTLTCRLRNGSIRYRLYGGWADTGMPFSVDNIQMKYAFELPIEPFEEETKEEFTRRVWMLLEDSTDKPMRSVNVNVKFADL